MNVLKGEITAIQSSKNLSSVTVDVNGIVFKVVVIETPESASYLKLGTFVRLIFKETEVVVTNHQEFLISIPNRIKGEISDLEKGKVLTKLTVTTNLGKLTSILLSEVVEKIQFEVGMPVYAMVKASEIMISA